MSAITFVNPQAVARLPEDREGVRGKCCAAHPVVVTGEVGLVPEVRNVVVRCGSQASSGLPVTERSPETTQLLEPPRMRSQAERVASRARSAPRGRCPRRPTTSPGVVTIGLPRGYWGSSRAARSGPRRARAGRGGARAPSSWRARTPSASRRRGGRSGPGLGLEAEDLKLDRQCCRRVDRGVDAGRIGVEQRPQAAWNVGLLALGDPAQPRVRISRSACSASGPRTRPGDRPSLGGRTRAATADPGRGRGRVRSTGRRPARAHVGNAEAVPQDVDRCVEPAQPHAAAGSGAAVA